MRVTALLCLSLLAAACSSEVNEADGEGGGGSSTQTSTSTGTDPSCQPPPYPIAFELGVGQRCFERVDDGSTVPLIAGPQGGYHVWMAFGCTDCGGQVHIRYGILDPVTGQTLDYTYPSESVVPLPASAWPQMAGLQVGMPGLEWDPENQPLPQGTEFILYLEALSSGTVIHSMQKRLFVGATEYWNPCEEDPEACTFD